MQAITDERSRKRNTSERERRGSERGRARNQGEKKRKERGGVGAEKEKVIDWSTISYVTRKLRRHWLHSQKYLDNLASSLFAVVQDVSQFSVRIRCQSDNESESWTGISDKR